MVEVVWQRMLVFDENLKDIILTGKHLIADQKLEIHSHFQANLQNERSESLEEAKTGSRRSSSTFCAHFLFAHSNGALLELEN